MLDYRINKKDMEKNKLDKIIVTIYENKKRNYIITTLQALEDYKKTGFLPYDKGFVRKNAAIEYLKK